jgi:predicted  nucleic acid-binding Zn-ribbon protein
MDIVAKLKDAYSFLGDPLHRTAYEEIERLRGQVEFERASLRSAFDELRERDNEIERLREDKAELVEALIDMRNHINKRDWDENVSNEAKATFAKATGD